MERQYIGARYVPKFFENSTTGDATWESNVPYEPLVMVTWMGNTYTSKKAVPANIGQPNSNPEYWVATGLYNEQVDSIRQAVESLEGDVEDLEELFPITAESIADNGVTIDKINKGITIIIADSYGYHPSVSTSWVAILAKKLGIADDTTTFAQGTNIVNDNLVTSIYGGVGFGTSEGNFTSMLQECINAIDTPDNVTRIIVCGGTNDMAYYNSTNIRNGISAFCTLAQTLENAKVYCGMIGNLLDSDYPTDNYQNVEYLYSVGDFIYLDGVECICKLRANMDEDGQHPNADGSAMLGRALYNCLMVGNTGYWDFATEEELTFSDGTNTFNIYVDIKFNKDTTNVTIRRYVDHIKKPTANYYAQLDSMTFCNMQSYGKALGFAPANNQGGDGMTIAFLMQQSSTPYKGKLLAAFFGKASDNDNFLGQANMVFNSHDWH